MRKQVLKGVRSARIEARPDPEAWGMDELMTLAEAAELHWPQGPITVPTLRTAVRDGQLAVCEIAGKFFLTRRLLLGLATGRILTERGSGARPDVPRGGMSVEEAHAIIARHKLTR